MAEVYEFGPRLEKSRQNKALVDVASGIAPTSGPDNDESDPNVLPSGVVVGIFEAEDCPGEWLVEAIDHDSEGDIYRTIFFGPRAEQRAREHALLVWGLAP